MTSEQYQAKLNSLLQLQVRPIKREMKCLTFEKHIESIAQGLTFARDGLKYASYQLWVDKKILVEYKPPAVHNAVMRGLFFLMPALDAMVIADVGSTDGDLTSTSFFTASLSNPAVRKIQDEIKALESVQHQTNTKSVDLKTVSNFFRHCTPYEQLLKPFTVKHDNGTVIDILDMFIAFECEESGPLLYDIIIPAYNKACELLELMAKAQNMSINLKKIDII